MTARNAHFRPRSCLPSPSPPSLLLHFRRQIEIDWQVWRGREQPSVFFAFIVKLSFTPTLPAPLLSCFQIGAVLFSRFPLLMREREEIANFNSPLAAIPIETHHFRSSLDGRFGCVTSPSFGGKFVHVATAISRCYYLSVAGALGGRMAIAGTQDFLKREISSLAPFHLVSSVFNSKLRFLIQMFQ